MKQAFWTIKLETFDFDSALSLSKYLDYLDDDLEDEDHIRTSSSVVYKSPCKEEALQEYDRLLNTLKPINNRKLNRARAFALSMKKDENSEEYGDMIAPNFPIEEKAEYIVRCYCFEEYGCNPKELRHRVIFNEWFQDQCFSWLEESDAALADAAMRIISNDRKWDSIYNGILSV